MPACRTTLSRPRFGSGSGDAFSTPDLLRVFVRTLRLTGEWLAVSGFEGATGLDRDRASGGGADHVSAGDGSHRVALGVARAVLAPEGDPKTAQWFLEQAISVSTSTAASAVPAEVLAAAGSVDQWHQQARKAHLTLAELADSLYTSLAARRASPEWAKAEALRKAKKLERDKLQVRRLGGGGCGPGCRVSYR